MEAAMLAEKDSKSELQAGDNSVLRVGDRVSGVDSFLANAGLSKKKPKMIVLNFFATWCGPCIAELPHLQELSDKYSNRDDILFVVVGREETQETLDAFVSKNGYRIQFIADPEKKLYSEFAKELIPRTYLIDEGRSIRFEILGFDQRKLEELDGMIEDFAK